MKTVKVKLAFRREKPVNFKLGEVNVSIGQKPVVIEKQYADTIMKDYPKWIELVVKPSRKAKTITKEA